MADSDPVGPTKIIGAHAPLPEDWADDVPDPGVGADIAVGIQLARGRVVLRYQRSSVAPAVDVVVPLSYWKRITAALLEGEAANTEAAQLAHAAKGLEKT